MIYIKNQIMKKQEEIYKLPSKWTWVSLSDIVINPKTDLVDGPFGSNLRAIDYQNKGIPVFRIQNIKAGYFVDKNIQYITYEKSIELHRHSFQSGDIIITKLGDPLGLACKVPEIYSYGIIVADLIRLRPSSLIVNTDFLIYLINSKVVQDQFKDLTKGTTRSRVNLTLVRDIKIPLPPKAEQDLIVSRIKYFLEKLENGICSLEYAQEQLKTYKQSLLKNAFSGELTKQWRNESSPEPAEKVLKQIKENCKERYNQDVYNWLLQVKEWESKGKKEKKPNKPILPPTFPNLEDEYLKKLPLIPDSWKWVRNSELLYYVTSGSRDWKKYYSKSGAYFIRTQDIKSYSLDLGNVAFVNLPPNIEGTRSLVEKGDLLMTITGANVGKVAFVNNDIPEAYVSQSVALMKPINISLAPYLKLYFQSEIYGGKMISELVYGVGRPVLSLENMREVPVPLCSFEEQKEITSKIELQFSTLDNIESTIDSIIKQSKDLCHSILNKAFKGKLVAQVPNSKPAIELLKLVYAKREVLEKEPKRKFQKRPLKVEKMNKDLNIEAVLKTSDAPMNAKDVWQQSKYRDNIEDFYKELKEIQDKVKVITKDSESLISLMK